ncbi:MAG: glutathione S-transferase family protein [Caulobacteraceae bacterium]
MPRLALYFAPGASSMAPHIALFETGAEFEAWPVSFHGDENRTPEFLALNPEGKVPVLTIDGRPLTEVAAILFYLARAFPKAALAPWGDTEAESRVVSWMSFIASSVHPARRQGLDAARRVWALADARLGESAWAAGAYSIADIHLFRLFWRFVGSLSPSIEEFPAVRRHYGRMMERPAVKAVLAAESAIGYELPG